MQSYDKDELRSSLKTLFRNRVRGLLEGQAVMRWRKKMESISEEIGGVDKSLKGRRVTLGDHEVLINKKKGLVTERKLIESRLEEFRTSMYCILSHLDGSRYNVTSTDQGKLNVLRFPGELDWNQIHFVIVRECRRLEDGLPIYSFRREILNIMHGQ